MKSWIADKAPFIWGSLIVAAGGMAFNGIGVGEKIYNAYAQSIGRSDVLIISAILA